MKYLFVCFSLLFTASAQDLSQEDIDYLKDELRLPETEVQVQLSFNEHHIMGDKKDILSREEAEELLEKEPGNLRAMRIIGGTMREEGDTTKSREVLEKALAMATEQYEADNMNGDKLMELIDCYNVLRRPVDMLNYLDKVPYDITKDAKVLSAVSLVFFQLQDLKRAAHFGEMAFNMEPGSPEVWVCKSMTEYTKQIMKLSEGATTLEGANWIDKVEQAYENKLHVQTLRYTNTVMLMMLQSFMHLQDEAFMAANFDTTVYHGMNDVDFGNTRLLNALLPAERKQVEDARDHFELLGDKGHADERFRKDVLMVAYWLLNDSERFEAAYASIKGLPDLDARIHHNACMIYAFNANLKKSIETIQAIENPKALEHLLLIRLYDETGDEEKSRTQAEQLIEMTKGFPISVQLAAFYQALDGEYAIAVELMKSIKDQPGDPITYTENEIIMDILAGNKLDAQYKMKMAALENEELKSKMEEWQERFYPKD